MLSRILDSDYTYDLCLLVPLIRGSKLDSDYKN